MRRAVLFSIAFLGALSIVVFSIKTSTARISLALSGQGALRVMTYNIHVGVGMDKKLDLSRHRSR